MSFLNQDSTLKYADLSIYRGVVTGKSGKTYWLNLDNLGGYQNGPNKLDDVIQVYQNENSVYAGGM